MAALNGLGFEERLALYQQMVRAYHATLDLVSDAALEDLPNLVEQAKGYADVIREVAPSGDILDLGSGAGLPGVVVASVFPSRRVWLVERRRRRATFLNMVVAKLGLDEAVVIEADVTRIHRVDLGLADEKPSDAKSGSAPRGPDAEEDSVASEVGRARGIEVVTAQAVASFGDIYCLTRHLHAAHVVLLSRKGPSWRAEMDALGDRIGAAPALAAGPVEAGGGTLVGIEVRGGLPCPRSA